MAEELPTNKPRVDSYALSHAQQRELITGLTFPGTTFANIVMSVRFADEIDFGKLEQAINLFIGQHDCLNRETCHD